jgi:hypothetical protein
MVGRMRNGANSLSELKKIEGLSGHYELKRDLWRGAKDGFSKYPFPVS